VAKLLRARERSARTPIIFVTAVSVGDASVTEGYSLGAVDFIFTPVVPEVLRAKVSVFVDLHTKTQELEHTARKLQKSLDEKDTLLKEVHHRVKNNLYSICCDEVSTRFRDFYRSFATVMGAQITISLVNTGLTAIFLIAVGMPHAPLLIAVTFLCGLVPIVGNLVSNTIIVFAALTVSLKLAIFALVFLIVIHKLEYFLNSKIIGDRIRNPVWLTLIALIIGERLMGIPGLILAPVVLNYLRVEMLTVEVRPVQEKVELVKSPAHESFRS